MYKYIGIVITAILLIILKCFLGNISAKTGADQKKNIPKKIIKQPNAYKYFGYIAFFSFIILMILCFLFSESIIEATIVAIIVFFPLSICGIIMILFGQKWKIEVNEDHFNFTNMFGKTKKYKFNEVTIKRIKSGFRIYKGNKHILGLGYYQVNCLALTEAIYKYNKSQK